LEEARIRVEFDTAIPTLNDIDLNIVKSGSEWNYVQFVLNGKVVGAVDLQLPSSRDNISNVLDDLLRSLKEKLMLFCTTRVDC